MGLYSRAFHLQTTKPKRLHMDINEQRTKWFQWLHTKRPELRWGDLGKTHGLLTESLVKKLHPHWRTLYDKGGADFVIRNTIVVEVKSVWKTPEQMTDLSCVNDILSQAGKQVQLSLLVNCVLQGWVLLVGPNSWVVWRVHHSGSVQHYTMIKHQSINWLAKLKKYIRTSSHTHTHHNVSKSRRRKTDSRNDDNELRRRRRTS
jgi:hypothetical protein